MSDLVLVGMFSVTNENRGETTYRRTGVALNREKNAQRATVRTRLEVMSRELYVYNIHYESPVICD